MERKSYSIDINRIAQYAMYAYCIFALFSLAFSVCGQAGLSFRTSPILIPISPILVTIKQLVLQLAPIALWGIFRYTLPAGVKLLRRCSEVDGALLCALIHPGTMLQVQLCNDDAGRTDNPHGNHSHLDTKHYGIDFRHRLPDSRLPSVQQAQR